MILKVTSHLTLKKKLPMTGFSRIISSEIYWKFGTVGGKKAQNERLSPHLPQNNFIQPL